MSEKKLNANNFRIKSVYKRSGLTYNKLSELTGIPRNTIACYITGRRTPSDIVTTYIEDKVESYLGIEESHASDEFINKMQVKDSFVKQVETACSAIEPEDVKTEVQDKIKTAFDDLPVLSAEQIVAICEQNLNFKKKGE